MRRKSHIITAFTIVILVGVAFLAPHMAHAQTGNFSLWGFNMWDFIAEMLAILTQWILSIMVLWVALTGALLNVSITLTLHIKDFVNSVSGVYLVWQTIRDISGLFIIFMLLYASFKIILGFDNVGSAGTLIKNIVIAGILINFSFFITSLLIDASNIVSLALYNGIVAAPTSVNADLNPKSIVESSMASGSDGGLSGLFMKYIAPQSIYSPDNIKLSGQGQSSSGFSKPLEIVIQGIAGVLVMFTSGMSFLLASLAFVARLAILIILLAFSPIWFAARIFPILKKKADEFWEHLYAQLVFMPIYLLLMYAALRVLSSSTIFTNPTTNVFQGSSGLSTSVWTNLMVLAINDFFILFLLNMPLVIAFSYGSMATDWLKDGVKKFGAANVWKNFGSQVGSRTLGRAAYWADTKATPWLSSKSPIAGSLSSKAFSSVSGAGFGVKKGGYEDRLKAKKDAQEKLNEKIGRLDRSQFKTQEEFEAAQKVVRGYQEKYRTNLPWKSSVMGFMLDNRANKQTAFSLKDDAEYKDNEKKQEEIRKDLKELETSMRLVATDEEKLRKGKLETELKEITAAMERASKKKGSKDIDELVKRVMEKGEKPKPEASEKKDDKK